MFFKKITKQREDKRDDQKSTNWKLLNNAYTKEKTDNKKSKGSFGWASEKRSFSKDLLKK